MRGTIRSWIKRAGHVTWLSGVLIVTMATNDDGACGSLPDDGGEAECSVAADCEGLPHIMCAGAWSCDAGVCEWDCSTPVGCQDNDDCPTGERCRDDGQCVPGPVDAGCYSSDDCGRGQHCNVDDGVCGTPPGCDAGEACPAVCYGQCVDDVDPCATMDCAPGTVCEDGQCVPVGEQCTSDADCREGYYCGCAPWEADAAGLIACEMRCMPKDPVACNYDGDCKEGQACRDGVCVDKPAECYSNEECGTGFYCDFSWCGGAATDPAFDPSDPGSEERPAPPCPGQCLPEGPTCADGQVCPRGHHCEERCTGACPPCESPDGANCDAACEVDCYSMCVPDSYGECQSDADCKDGFYCGGCDNWLPTPNGIAVCMTQCLPKDPQPVCRHDYECGPNQRCDLIACDLPARECDPSSGEDCDARPAVPDSCWGYCVDHNPECQSDADCGEGYFCEIEWCSGADDADFWPGNCGGHCKPRDLPPGECESDWDCVNANGQQGWCQRYCETWPVDTDGNGIPDCDPNDASCGGGAMPPYDPYCKGICEYPQDPPWCDPADPGTCPEGTHCESTCNGGFLPNGLVMCPSQCVPDDKKCETNCECEVGEVCQDGTCQRPETFQCDDAWQCPEGFVCGCAYSPNMGVPCYPSCIPERPACCSDADCGSGNQCVDGACEPFYCWDGACPDGYSCKSQCDWATPANGLVMCPQVCVADAPACQSDCDCPSSETCNNGECLVTDRPNQCYPQGCQDNSQCGAGEECIVACPACLPGYECPPCWGFCVAAPECKEDADCGPGQHCERDVQCPDCADGDPACLAPCTISETGVCVDDPTDPAECREDSDCGPGMECNEYCPPCACPVNEDGTWGPCPWCECKTACEPADTDPQPGACFVGGCSGQICSADPGAVSTCEWRPEYACYRLAKCDVQATGQCGWTPNDEFEACMANGGVDFE